jgi:hypothetical protein
LAKGIRESVATVTQVDVSISDVIGNLASEEIPGLVACGQTVEVLNSCCHAYLSKDCFN